jgi:molecular chaperone HscB
MATDHFARLELPRRHDLSADEIEAKYRELSRKWHPDRFARAAAKERVASLQAATALNDAYRVVKDPVKRAEHLLALESGLAIAENEAVSPELLEEVLELREALAEVGGGPGADELVARARARRDEAVASVARGFASGAAPADIKELLVTIRYFQRFLDEHERMSEKDEQ